MKRKLLLAVIATTTLAAAPFVAQAESRHHDGDRWEHQRPAPYEARKPYTKDEIQIMADARALRIMGPGAKASVKATDRGTFMVDVTDPKGHLVHETEVNVYGFPLHGFDRDHRGYDRHDDDRGKERKDRS